MGRFGGGFGSGMPGGGLGGGPGSGLGPGFAGSAGMGGGGGFRRTMRDAPKPTQPIWPTIRRTTKLLAHYRLQVLGYLTTIVIASLLGLVTPLLTGAIIDKALANADRALLITLVSIWVLSVAAAAGVGTLQAYLGNSMAHSVMFDLRSRLYKHLTGMSLRWFTSNRTGEVLSRISNDVAGIQTVISDTLGGVLGNLITVVSTFAVMVTKDPIFAVGSLVSVPLFIIPARRVGQMQRALVTETQEQMAGMNAHMQETLSVSGALLVKTFGRQDEEIETFQETAGSIRDLNIRRAMIGRWFNMAMGLYGSIAPAFVYLYVGIQVINHQATVGEMVALAALLTRLFGPISSLMNLNITAMSSIALFERIFDYLDLDHDIKDRPGAVDLKDVGGRISFENVDFEYVAGHPTLRNVSFEVEPGKFGALVGPTGAGKTTIAYLVPRLYDVKEGRVLVDEHDVRDVTLASLGDNVGMVNQEPFLFHTSIGQNLRYARPDATEEEIHEAAKAANIHDFILNLPWGYDTIVGERGYRLSGGEKQRVAIARALLKNPSILILDEATSSVDSETEHAIQEALARLTRGRTVLAIAHRLSTIVNADVILVVDGGEVVEQGTHEELLARGGRYARLYEQQFGRREVISLHEAPDEGALAVD
ncbi:MAG TPA: ABC transporter ATP-binding protein [Dehalococcoidia bacterium]